MATADLSPSAAASASPPGRLSLTPEQQQSMLAATAELVCATSSNRRASFPDPTLAGAVDQLVSGVFVSLKRGKHLRACVGGLQDQPVPLGKVLSDAAIRCVLDDYRFPPVSPNELAHLRLEIWLLHSPERMRARGEARVEAVTVGGKHGLVVVRGSNRGLLLPGVAAENNWDALRFLQQTCIKAGMHPSLWKDDATAIFTFEGDVLHGPVAEPPARDTPACSLAPIGPQDLSPYTAFCRDNLYALLNGALPTYYLFNKPDFNVGGVCVHLRGTGPSAALDLCHFSLRQGVPLQATLFRLTQEAAKALASRFVAPDDLDDVSPGLTILLDVHLHGNVSDPELTGLDPCRRGVVVFERNRAGLVFDPERDPPSLVSEAATMAEVHGRSTAAVYSLEVLTSEPCVHVTTAPRPQPGLADRPPAMAGKFYPADAVQLSRLLDGLLAEEPAPEPWPAAMVPHAGLAFSGRIAAAVFRRLRIPKQVIVLSPKHTTLGMEWAVAPHQTWSLPGGAVASDPDLARRLVQSIPGLTLDAAAHQQEHGIEVELPFLARLAPAVQVVGITIGYADLAGCLRFAEGLADVLRSQDEPPLLLISSDMNHFATDAETRLLDELALGALQGLDPADVYDIVTENQISMCGVLPAVIVLETLRRLGRLKKAERVAYGTTADVTGDATRVVGYAGMLFGT